MTATWIPKGMLLKRDQVYLLKITIAGFRSRRLVKSYRMKNSIIPFPKKLAPFAWTKFYLQKDRKIRVVVAIKIMKNLKIRRRLEEF